MRDEVDEVDEAALDCAMREGEHTTLGMTRSSALDEERGVSDSDRRALAQRTRGHLLAIEQRAARAIRVDDVHHPVAEVECSLAPRQGRVAKNKMVICGPAEADPWPGGAIGCERLGRWARKPHPVDRDGHFVWLGPEHGAIGGLRRYVVAEAADRAAGLGHGERFYAGIWGATGAARVPRSVLPTSPCNFAAVLSRDIEPSRELNGAAIQSMARHATRGRRDAASGLVIRAAVAPDSARRPRPPRSPAATAEPPSHSPPAARETAAPPPAWCVWPKRAASRSDARGSEDPAHAALTALAIQAATAAAVVVTAAVTATAAVVVAVAVVVTAADATYRGASLAAIAWSSAGARTSSRASRRTGACRDRRAR